MTAIGTWIIFSAVHEDGTCDIGDPTNYPWVCKGVFVTTAQELDGYVAADNPMYAVRANSELRKMRMGYIRKIPNVSALQAGEFWRRIPSQDVAASTQLQSIAQQLYGQYKGKSIEEFERMNPESQGPSMQTVESAEELAAQKHRQDQMVQMRSQRDPEESFYLDPIGTPSDTGNVRAPAAPPGA